MNGTIMNATKKSFVIAFLKIFVTFWLNVRLADKLQEKYREILSRVTVYLACLYPHLTLITNEGSSSGCHLPEGTWLTHSFTPGLLFFPNWLSSPPICCCLTGVGLPRSPTSCSSWPPVGTIFVWCSIPPPTLFFTGEVLSFPGWLNHLIVCGCYFTSW